MNDYRGVSDEELERLLLKLEDQARHASSASTALGRKLFEQLRESLASARAERQRRNDWVIT
jgi:hypothetical protein